MAPPELVKKAQETALRQAADIARLKLEFGRLDSNNYITTLSAIQYYMERYKIEIDWAQWNKRYYLFEEPLEYQEKEEVMGKDKPDELDIMSALYNLAINEASKDMGMTEEEMYDLLTKIEVHYRLLVTLNPEGLLKRMEEVTAWTKRMQEKLSDD